jgi:hypothetical protein
MLKAIAVKEFTADMILEGSWGATNVGRHSSTMTLYPGSDSAHFCIEWDIPGLDTTEEIGLYFELEDGKLALVDYDGVFLLPREAVYFLREQGFVVPAEFVA